MWTKSGQSFLRDQKQQLIDLFLRLKTFFFKRKTKNILNCSLYEKDIFVVQS